ncbi:hypothetical protein ACOMHN_007343 [Nucella lapillus]
MDRNYREVGRSSLIGDYDDYRSYNRQGGESSYVDRDPPQRESYSAGLGRSSYGYGHDRDMVETIMQQHALKQQLSIRESQLALASNLLQQQQQQEFFLQKRRMDSRDRFSRDDFKRPRMMDSRPRHRSRSSGTSGRDSGPGGRGGRGGSNIRRNQSSPRGSSGRSRSPKESYDPEKPTADYDGKVRCKSCNMECKDDENLKKHLATKEHRERVDHLKNRGSKNHCNICDVELKGSFLQHQRMTFHKKRHIQVTKGCAWCKVTSFKNFTEVLEHRATESHIKNQKLYDKRKKGSEKSSTDSKRSDSRSRKEREPIKVVLPPELEKFDEKVVTGQACVIAVTGWFCKVCNKFYNNESAAKETHCMSELHFNNYKKLMHAKLKAKAEAERDDKEKAEEEERKKAEAEEKMEEGTEESAEPTGEGETKEGTEGAENAGGGEEEEAGEEGGEGEEEEEEAGEEEEGGAGEEVLDEPEDEYVDDEDLAATEESLCEPSTEAKGDQSGPAEVENAEAMSQEEKPAPAATEGTIEAEGGEEEEEEEEEEQEPEEVKKVTRSSPSRGRGGRGANRARRGRRVVK